jgi:MYXO-CTERM domain-containing protein
VTITGSSPQNTANITLTFCLGATSTPGCPASNLGQIIAVYSGPNPTATYTCTFSGCVSSTGNTVNIGGSITQVAVSESVTLASANTSGESVAINNIADQFGEFASGATASTIPEPTAGLMAGAGLVAIALLRRRRQRG